MKNIPIKFRGVSELTGKIVYGVGVKDYGDNRVDIITGGMALEAVKADSVAQLVGYNLDGTEIYEGDTVDAFCDENSEAAFSFKAQLADNITLPDPVTNIKYRVRRKTNE